MSSMLASHTSNIAGGTFTLVNGDMHYHGPQESGSILENSDDENPPLSICPFFQHVQLSLLSVGPLVSSPKTSFQVSIEWEGIPLGVRICAKKILANYNGSYILQVDRRLEMAESSGKGHVFATVLPGGMHEFIKFVDQVLNCKEVELTLLFEGSSSSCNHDHHFRMEKSITVKGFDSFRPLITLRPLVTLRDLDICESNGKELTAMLNVKIKSPTNIKVEIGAPGLGVEVRFANQKVGYAKLEDVCLQHNEVFHRRIQWKLEPFLNKDHISAFISRCLLDRGKIPLTLHVPVCFAICGHLVKLDPLVVPANIKGIGFQPLQELRTYLPLTKIFSGNIHVKFSMENPISADLQIRFVSFVAFEFGRIFEAEHKFKDFVLTSQEVSWSPKVMSKVSIDTDSDSDTDYIPGRVGDIFASANITIRTPGANRGLDLQNLDFHLRDVPFEGTFTL